MDERTQRLTPAHARTVREMVDRLVRETRELPMPLTFLGPEGPRLSVWGCMASGPSVCGRACEKSSSEGRWNGASLQTLHPQVGPGRPLRRSREPLGCT